MSNYSVTNFWFHQFGFSKNEFYNTPPYIIQDKCPIGQDSGLWIDCMVMYLQIYKKKCLHIFIDSIELFDFLKNQDIKDESINIFNNDSISENNEYKDYDNNTIHNGKTCTIVIHHKYKKYYSIIYSVLLSENNEIINKKAMMDKPIEIVGWVKNLLYNTFFYIEAFPKCVSSGSPNEIKEFDKFYNSKNNRLKLITEESLIDKTSITPHFRRGHFVRLESERFVNKKGTVIFRKSTFVKGHAITVE